MANFELILLALIAVFIFLRLRSVLGSRDGNEDNRNHYDRFNDHASSDGDADDTVANDNVIQMPNTHPSMNPVQPVVDVVEPTNEVQKGLADIMEQDESFDPQGFVEGAKVAFEMILTAFANDDRDMLKSLLTPEVYQNFELALDARKAAGETLESTLIGITGIEITEASLQNSTAEVTLRIQSEQVNVTTDADGAVVDGDSNYIDKITDIWTFVRDVNSGAPNWFLEATQSE